MSGFRDIHAHFIYGVDDGAKNREDMEAMLDAAHANGVVSLYATPHVTPGVYPFDQEVFLSRLSEAQAYCSSKGYPMLLHAGAEIMYTPMLKRTAAEGKLPTMGNTRCILMEFVPDISASEMEAALSMMQRAGYTTILAHIERYDCLYKRDYVYRFKDEYDIRYQMNCSSLIDGRGFFKNRAIRKWLRDELIDFAATDMHDCKRRPCRMREAYDALCRDNGEDYANRLMGVR